jgi:hypothetical protein
MTYSSSQTVIASCQLVMAPMNFIGLFENGNARILRPPLLEHMLCAGYASPCIPTGPLHPTRAAGEFFGHW